MRIALYTGTFVKDKDGVARTLYEFVNCIKDEGHEVKVWSPDISEKVNEDKVKVTKLVSIPVLLYPDYKVGFFGARAKMQLDEFAPDIIHVSTPDLVGREFLQYGRRNNIPVVSVYHTDFPSYLSYYNLEPLSPPVWGYLRWFYNQSHYTLVPTETMGKKLKGKGIDNIHIWSRGIKSSRFSPEKRSEKIRDKWGVDGKFTILYSGRFVWYKDLKDFIGVYDRLMNKRDDVAFVLLGSGPIEKELKEAMPDAVFPGYLTGDDLGIAYASADLFFFPSTTETFGNVVQEALASGTPAVVSDKGGCKDIVNTSGGGLVSRSNDIRSFQKNIEKIIDNKDLYRELRNNGLNYGMKRSWKRINRELLRIYGDLVRSGDS